MTSYYESDEYKTAMRMVEHGRQLQNEQDSQFRLSEAYDLEGSVWNGFNEIEFLPPISSKGLMAIGWTTLVIRQSHLVFRNYELGLRDVLVPNVRTAFEHAIYTSLLVSADFDENSFDRLDIRPLSIWKEVFASVESDEEEDLIDFGSFLPEHMMPQRRSEDEWIAKVEQVCNVFEESQNLYQHYRILSGFVHPNFQSAQTYVQAHIFNREEGFSVTPDFSFNTHLLTTALSATVWALSALNEVLGTNYLEELLPSMAEVAEVSIKLRLKDSTPKT